MRKDRDGEKKTGKTGKKTEKQAGAELGQAQLKLELNFTLIFCWFDSSGFNLV